MTRPSVLVVDDDLDIREALRDVLEDEGWAVAGAVFALMIMAVAAAEVTVGLALVIAIIRTRQTPEVDQYSDLKE